MKVLSGSSEDHKKPSELKEPMREFRDNLEDLCKTHEERKRSHCNLWRIHK